MLNLVKEWDKVFPKNENVNHKKVTFKNHFGIELAADMYWPKKEGKYPAIAVSGPFGAVKEQSSGLYAQEMASRGFLTIAFDPSFTGESGGFPRRMNGADINTEDFQAAIDYLSNLENVDPNKISILGVCGWGGMAIQTAAIDTRIKATVAVTLYDLARVRAKGYFDKEDSEEKRYQTRKMISEQRTIDYKNETYKMAGGIPKVCPDNIPDFFKQYHEYYQGRGFHERSGNSTDGWTINTLTSLLNMHMFDYASEIRSAVMVVHGENAHSRYMGEDVFKLLKGDNKKLLIVPDATHCDLYDGGANHDKIPFDKIEEFIRKNI